MIKLSIRTLTNNKLRFSLTTFAVLMGVSFVVASFVLTDGLMRTFNNIVEDANEEVDVEVRAASTFDEVTFGEQSFDESIYDTVVAVEGVQDAIPIAASLKIQPLTPDGETIDTLAPVFGFSWSNSPLDGLTLVAGEVPDGPREFALDETSADDNGFVLGQTYDIVGAAGREPFELVGINKFGEENALAGAVIVSFTLDEVQRLDDSEGLIQYIDIAAAPGVEPEVLIDRIENVLPAGLEAVSGEVVVDEAQDDFSTIVDIFGNVLLAFALVAVFVSTFIISNTFNILLGQRVRQLALLRALGASSGQVRFSSIFESLVIGVIASVLGLGGGVLLAFGLRELMNSLGMQLPSMDIILAPRTIIAALIVGVGVTLLASLTPARRAANVPPIAAMRAGFRFGSGEGTRRTIIAIVLSVFGVIFMAYGLFGGSDNTGALLGSLGLGAVLVFVAVSMYAPLFSSPSASFLGAPLEHVPGNQITGHMARQNAARNNKRTASTAAGLMIGLALIAMASVVAESLKSSFRDELGSTMVADYVITADGDVDFTNQLAGQVAALPEFDEVSAVRSGNIRVDGDTKEMRGADLTILTDLMAVDVQSGDPAAAANPNSIILSQEAADDYGVVVGDRLNVEFAATGLQVLTVQAIYDNPFLVTHHMIDLSAWEQYFDSQNDSVISARVADGVSLTAAAAALEPFATEFPQLLFETQEEFRDRLEGTLDSLLIIINVFLGLAIVIALLGITNTMALSVLERTQEIGLMRAIGMTRRQTRGLIRFEAAVVSLFGALLGVVVGLAFGWVAVIAIPESIINQLSIPAVLLVVYVVIATIAGLLAASLPARRAARLNVLEAIAFE
ncbi:MAG: FtsX-like permease family protein [Ilumatobacter sp.]|uniref:ABC transporter permease n=1 Tax=Ilumatobacter sp. TaxID=1967498 RepID=UPI00261FBA01|nr:ABC transporter permease [Ilumatobacter sp.]MDJ0768233.1 FtsX-like permease family protein [Ilumatobacter sp.]